MFIGPPFDPVAQVRIDRTAAFFLRNGHVATLSSIDCGANLQCSPSYILSN